MSGVDSHVLLFSKRVFNDIIRFFKQWSAIKILMRKIVIMEVNELCTLVKVFKELWTTCRWWNKTRSQETAFSHEFISVKMKKYQEIELLPKTFFGRKHCSGKSCRIDSHEKNTVMTLFWLLVFCLQMFLYIYFCWGHRKVMHIKSTKSSFILWTSIANRGQVLLTIFKYKVRKAFRFAFSTVFIKVKSF